MITILLVTDFDDIYGFNPSTYFDNLKIYETTLEINKFKFYFSTEERAAL